MLREGLTYGRMPYPRAEKVLIDSHSINCITFDEVHDVLRNRFILYRAASRLEKKRRTKK